MVRAQDDADINQINLGTREGFDTSQHLKNALEQARERGYDRKLIIDVDAHHYETDEWAGIVNYIEDPVLRHRAEQGLKAADSGRELMHRSPKGQSVAGRITRYQNRRKEEVGDEVPRDVSVIRRTMKAIGIDYQVVFPTPMLELGLHPDEFVEQQVSWAYTRWFTEEILPHDDAIKTMVFLPMNSPDACVKVVERFHDAPGVVGFMVSAARRTYPIHHNSYTPLYKALEEVGKPLGFHAVFDQKERMFEGMNRFISVHSLGFVLFNMIHMTNWIFNGMPERFPKLDTLWIESGLAWLPFMAQRLDNEFLMRSSEAPLLKKKPSEYMKDFYYSTQPMELTDLEALEVTFRMINAESQLCFSSDYPHWDFDLPSTVSDLPFLDEAQKDNILGLNAARLFKLPTTKPGL